MGGEGGTEAERQRGEAAIEADGKDARRRTGDRHGRVEVRFGERQRLLDPDGFVGDERGAGERAMLIMTGRDEDRRETRVVKQHRRLGRRGRGGTGEQLGRKPVGRSEDGRSRRERTQRRDEDAGGEVTATDDAEATGHHAIAVEAGNRPGERVVRGGVFDDQAEGAGATQVIVDLWCFGERMTRRQQRGDIESAGGHEREDLVEVDAG